MGRRYLVTLHKKLHRTMTSIPEATLKRLRDGMTDRLLVQARIKRRNECYGIASEKRKHYPRLDSVHYPRLDLRAWFWQRRNDPTLETELRMTRTSFEKLCNLIMKDLVVNEAMANLRGGAILPEACLYMTLRFLAGGAASDIKNHCGVSKEAFYLCRLKTLHAIFDCDALAIHFPQTEKECEAHAEGFRQVTGNAILNCVSVIDGLHLQIKSPPSTIIPNVRAYFSGHHKTVGVNVQAACDHLCRFTAVSVETVGSMHDRLALTKTFIYPMIQKLPNPYVVIGDAAYGATEHVVPVYCGPSRLIPLYDNFNYCASTARIRIEMAFGLQKSKFLIYKSPLMCSPKNIPLYIMVIARLHNYIINERIESDTWDPQFEYNGIDGDDGLVQPSVPMDENGEPILLDDEPNPTPGYSAIREEMAHYCAKEGYKRPI